MLNRRSFLRASLVSPLTLQIFGSAAFLHAADEQENQRDDTLTKGRPTNVETMADAIVIKNEAVFFVAQPDGSVPLHSRHGMGLYYRDCRYLNGYELRLADRPPVPLSASSVQGSSGVFTLTNPQIELPGGGALDKEEIGVTWRRLIDSDQPALLDRLTFRNFTLRPIQFDITLTFRSGFEDLFSVRGLLSKQYGRLREPAWDDGVLRLIYDGKDGVRRALSVHADPLPDERQGSTAMFHVRVGPQEQQDFRLSLVIEESKDPNATPVKPRLPDFTRLESELEEDTQAWIAQVTHISSNGSALDQLMDRSFRGLRMLRTHLGREAYFAAGVPWFVTLFGRDSLITAWQMLAYHHGIAEQTLRLLARYQGMREDDWRDEQPGKILHELRVGEMANLNEIPHTPFYGTVDATPLFLMLVAEHAAWTGSLRLFDDLRPHIERALSWMDTYGDHRGDGYLSYISRAKDNLINKGWKDSGDAIVTAAGSLAEPPIALVEVQAYAYAAKRGMAALFARAGERERADRLTREAQLLRERFNRDFWMEDKDCYALALHGKGHVASVISSNPGHALWTGIADEEKARRTIQRLMADDMFTGWGVRTLSSQERAYNPIGYHLGTVWPHDNAILAAGFRRYGSDREALRIFHGLFDAAFHFRSHQLPELFCGFSQKEYEIPISYPVACHPQAWASGSLPFILASLLGLEPDGFGKRLHIVRPVLPDGLDRLALRRLRVGGAAVDLNFKRATHGTRVDVLKIEGELEVQVAKEG